MAVGGGIGWTGASTCVSGSCCTYSNDWYSQCLPCTGNGGGGEVTTTTSIPPSSTGTEPKATWSTLSNVKVFGPGSGYTAPGVLYARSEIIGNTLFATAENCKQTIGICQSITYPKT